MLGEVLITGGTGYVGGWVTQALLQKGYNVTLLTRNPHLQNQTQNIVANLTDPDSLNNALAERYFDVVIHLAAAGERQHEADIWATNYDGTLNLLLALRRHPPKKIVYVSTVKVYGAKEGVITENTPTEPQGAYGKSKLVAESLVQIFCHETQTEAVILRLSNAYGAPKSLNINNWHLLFNNLCLSAFQEGAVTLKSPPDTQLDMIWLNTVCQVITEAAAGPHFEGVFNLGSGQSITTGQVAAAIDTAYQQYSGQQLSINMPQPAGNINPLRFDCSKLQARAPYPITHHFENEAIKLFHLLKNKHQQ